MVTIIFTNFGSFLTKWTMDIFFCTNWLDYKKYLIHLNLPYLKAIIANLEPCSADNLQSSLNHRWVVLPGKRSDVISQACLIFVMLHPFITLFTWLLNHWMVSLFQNQVCQFQTKVTINFLVFIISTYIITKNVSLSICFFTSSRQFRKLLGYPLEHSCYLLMFRL